MYMVYNTPNLKVGVGVAEQLDDCFNEPCKAPRSVEGLVNLHLACCLSGFPPRKPQRPVEDSTAHQRARGVLLGSGLPFKAKVCLHARPNGPLTLARTVQGHVEVCLVKIKGTTQEVPWTDHQTGRGPLHGSWRVPSR